MPIKNWKKELLTIPNLLSLFRLILIPVYMTVYLRAQTLADYALAAGILAVSCLTDAIDGKVARHFHMISTVGKVLDPIADKVTQFTLILCLAIRYPVVWSLVGLFVVKESFQLIAGILMLRKGKMLNGALISGKICTTVLFVSLIVLVLLPKLPTAAIYGIVALDFCCMTAALIAYGKVYFTNSPKIQQLSRDTDT